jgi:hypothetical protein
MISPPETITSASTEGTNSTWIGLSAVPRLAAVVVVSAGAVVVVAGGAVVAGAAVVVVAAPPPHAARINISAHRTTRCLLAFALMALLP